MRYVREVLDKHSLTKTMIMFQNLRLFGQNLGDNRPETSEYVCYIIRRYSAVDRAPINAQMCIP